MHVLGIALGLLLMPAPHAWGGVSLMAYNLENLFDTFHDPGKNDFTYLPRAVKPFMPGAWDFCRAQIIPVYREQCFELDWRPEVLDAKIRQIARVVRAAAPG